MRRHPQFAFGHARLRSSIPPAATTFEPTTARVTFNGEIYNYLRLRDELARSATRFGRRRAEVLPPAIGTESGSSTPDGMFALRHTARRRSSSCARDPFRQKPFFYWQDGGRLAFSSNARSSPAFGRDRTRSRLPRVGCTLRSRSIYRGVRLPPGHFLTS
jgi:asparagine synthase (glutamine-hydrolysing)